VTHNNGEDNQDSIVTGNRFCLVQCSDEHEREDDSRGNNLVKKK
jgi:hypothetical protein